jgi:hypothetical protein
MPPKSTDIILMKNKIIYFFMDKLLIPVCKQQAHNPFMEK